MHSNYATVLSRGKQTEVEIRRRHCQRGVCIGVARGVEEIERAHQRRQIAVVVVDVRVHSARVLGDFARDGRICAVAERVRKYDGVDVLVVARLDNVGRVERLSVGQEKDRSAACMSSVLQNIKRSLEGEGEVCATARDGSQSVDELGELCHIARGRRDDFVSCAANAIQR